ncbi:cytochrome C oxidase subunit II [Cerasibacillus sp. JNUCC 74]
MKKVLLSAVLLFLFFLAACGDEDDSEQANGTDATESNATNQIDMTATNFTFDKPEYVVNAGEEITISLTNEEGQHGIGINEFDVNIQGNGKVTFTPNEPGEYTIYCNVPCGEGHADMKSTLTVQ